MNENAGLNILNSMQNSVGYQICVEIKRRLPVVRGKVMMVTGFLMLILFLFKACFPDVYYVSWPNPKTMTLSRGSKLENQLILEKFSGAIVRLTWKKYNYILSICE